MKKKIFALGIAAALLLIHFQPCSAEQDLKIAFGNALLPWVIPETGNGILIDIVRETLEPAGYRIQPVYLPYARRLVAYRTGRVDAVCDINPNIIEDSRLKGYFSGIVYAYENIGVSLRKNGYRFLRISDLAGHSIVSWQGAKAAIGGEYAEMAENNSQYRELADQKAQIMMLYTERTDIIQLDQQIFKYFRKKVAEKGHIDTNRPVDIFPLFGKNECGFLFRDKKVQKEFMLNFTKLKDNGRIDRIFEIYTE